MKYFLTFLILAALAGGGYYGYMRWKAANNNTTVAQATEKVSRRTIEKIVSANGKVASNRDVDIKCQASGAIDKLPYTDVGVEIQPGTLLCHLNPVDEQHLLDTAKAVVDADEARLQEAKLNRNIANMSLDTTRQRDEAALASAKARAAQAHAKANRTKDLYDTKLASQEDLEADQTTAAQADADVQTATAAIAELDQQKISVDAKEQTIKEMEAALAQDKTRLDEAQQNVDYCTVNSPALSKEDEKDPPRWFISSLLTNIAPGYIVQSGTSGFSAGTTIMTLSDLSHIYILASVDESDIGSVTDPVRGAMAQDVRVTADSFPGQVFDGKVVRVATKGVNTSNVVTFEVKIEVTSTNRILLRPEMSATARIVVASRPDSLAIPMSAFRRADPGDMSSGGDTGSVPVSMVSMQGGDDRSPATEPAAGPTSAPGRRGGGRGRGGDASGAGGQRRGGGRRGGVDANGMPLVGAPMNGTVQVLGTDSKTETRSVTVGLSDDTYYEVIKGLDEGETVVLSRSGSDSRFKNGNPGANPLRGLPGSGGRGR